MSLGTGIKARPMKSVFVGELASATLGESSGKLQTLDLSSTSFMRWTISIQRPCSDKYALNKWISHRIYSVSCGYHQHQLISSKWSLHKEMLLTQSGDNEADSVVCLISTQSYVPEQSRHKQEQNKLWFKIFVLLLVQPDMDHNLIYNYTKKPQRK